MFKILPILFLCTFCIACNQNTTSSPKVKTAAQNQADWETTSKVKLAIRSNKSIAANNRLVSISTNKGVVTLSGTISTQDQMTEIVNTAVNVGGVKKVDNQMTLAN